MATEVPAEATLAQAATLLRMDIIEVALRWTEALTRARTHPLRAVGRNGIVTAAQLLTAMNTNGVLAAFELWLADPMDPHEDQWSSVTNVQTSASVDWNTPTLETARAIRIEIDPAICAENVRRDVLPYIESFDDWDGRGVKTLRIEFAGTEFKDYSVAISSTNLSTVLQEFHDIIVDNEFLEA